MMWRRVDLAVQCIWQFKMHYLKIDIQYAFQNVPSQLTQVKTHCGTLANFDNSLMNSLTKLVHGNMWAALGHCSAWAGELHVLVGQCA